MDEDRGEPEAQLEEMQRDADRLGEHVEAARDDWEAKKADPAVPGADGEPEAAASDGQPEAAHPAVGDAGDGGEDVPGGDIDVQDPANEDL